MRRAVALPCGAATDRRLIAGRRCSGRRMGGIVERSALRRARARHRARAARYEALFAARTRGMNSSAMREMMALTERPEVISLAGGLPDTSTFAPELYAKLMAQVAAESTARALQYGPTEGMAATVDCIVEVMARGGHVRRSRRGDRHDRRPAGDRPGLQDADRPGRRDRRRGPHLPGRGADLQRLPGRRRADRDRRRRDADRRAREHARPARRRRAAGRSSSTRSPTSRTPAA